jgi:glycine cleavage system H protein
MPEWGTIRVRAELVTAAKRTSQKGGYRSLSEFVSEAIRMRLDEQKRSLEEIPEKQVGYPVIQERLLYSPNHMWARVTLEGKVRVGLSDYAQRHLKGIAGIETDPVGCKVEREEPFGVVETWMFMFDLYSPVSGRIIKINNVLRDEPFIINDDPYGMAWIAEVEPLDLVMLEDELRHLMTLHEYKLWVTKAGRPRILSP